MQRDKGGMALVRRRWVLEKEQARRRALAAELAREAGLPPFAALLALNRGLETAEDIADFLGAGETAFVNPYELPDMEPAVERIEHAIEAGEHITVFGDYDADGVTATALLYTYLSGRTGALSYHIPDRKQEGYGLTVGMVDILAERGTKLVVTVDNGVSALREIAHAKALGIDVVVTDHHQIGHALPECRAVVNPHRADCDLLFKDYAGVGVAFLLVCALEGCEPEELLPEYADLVALGTVADIVPLLGENRAFTRAGLELLNGEEQRLGLMALRRAAHIEKKHLSATGLAFTLGPRINAAGRMEHANLALELLLTRDAEQAERLAQRLELLNEERQQAEQNIMDQALAALAAEPARQYDRVLVFAGEGWHEGVIGIVASRMVERFGRPCLLLSVNGEFAKGSGRSLPGFSLFEAVHNSRALMVKYGGHELAAGFTLASADVERFREEINAYAAQGDMPFPVQTLDARLNPALLAPELADEIALLEPFGQGNPQPVFVLRQLALRAATPVAGGKHLRLTLEREGALLSAMAFHTRREEFPCAAGDVVDIAVTLEAGDYMGNRELTLILKNARYSAIPNEALLQAQRLVETALRGDALPEEIAGDCVPRRETATHVYRALERSRDCPLAPEALFLALGEGFAEKAGAEDFVRVWLAAEVLRELGLLAVDPAGRMALLRDAPKARFEDSALLQRLQGGA